MGKGARMKSGGQGTLLKILNHALTAVRKDVMLTLGSASGKRVLMTVVCLLCSHFRGIGRSLRFYKIFNT